MFSEFRRYGIPYFFLLRIFRILYGIAQNSAELCGIPYCRIRRIPRNFAEFRDLWCNDIPHNFNFTTAGFYNTVGWGKGEMAQFKGTVLRDRRISNFFDFFFQGVICIRNRLPGVFTT